ncbi:MAG: excinuclease ABC subunit UvrC [Treponema sp.]|nr:excinuclease ABC subunit UvrC [Treponema sp.]
MNLKKIAGEAPREPGVYLIRDSESRIIYVGKARILRNRLTSYFSGEKDIKTRILLRNAASIETIIVKDEYEALLLENTLIKQHSPKYNINLKDGKTYPVIRLTAEPYPRVFRTRHIIEDGSAYFGPFPNVGAMDDMLGVIDRIFPLRKCKQFKKRNYPCMYYHIGRCTAPCCEKPKPEIYAIQVDRVAKLLSGDTTALISELSSEMREEAASLRFERAAQLRNAIKIIEGLNGTSVVVDFDPNGRDYIAWAIEGMLAVYSVFSMREGKLTGRELYRTRSASGESESLITFIAGYYNGERLPPGQIYLQSFGNQTTANHQVTESTEQAFDIVSLGKWFREQFSLDPQILVPDDKHHKAVMAMTRQNAEEELRRRLRERGAGPALDELKKCMNLKNRPERIEGFDIAQLDGKHPVASLVSFAGGMPDKKNYRRFKLRSVIGVVDDFAAMREAVERRYSRLVREHSAEAGTTAVVQTSRGSPPANRELPDLILIDGGIGQVNAAKGVLDELGLDCDVAGLAKREEEIWFPNAKEPLVLARNSEALKLLQFVRDETHRFATSLNQKLRSKDLKLLTLESVEGIGPKRAAVLLNHFKNIESISAAEAEDIARVCGCGLAAARAVRAAAGLAVTERKHRTFTVGSRNKTALAGKTIPSGGYTAGLAADALEGGMAAESEEKYE